jgi:hypothetical protein
MGQYSSITIAQVVKTFVKEEGIAVIVILTFSEEDQNKPYKCSSVEE